MRKYIQIVYILILLLMIGCSDNNPSRDTGTEGGNIPLNISLEQPLTHGYDIDSVYVTIHRNSFFDSMNLEIEETLAHGIFEDLLHGTYEVNVYIYEDTILIARGSGTAEVLAGQTTELRLTVEYEPGNLVVIVDWNEPVEIPQRILFLGNSYTYTNGGINTHVLSMIQELYPTEEVVVDAITGGGMTLQGHFNTQSTINSITSGNYDCVILQEQSQRPVLETDMFYEYATRLDSVIAESGAETAFFMTWAREYDPPMINGLDNAYSHIADSLDAILIPVGRAFSYTVENHPEYDLYIADGSHPSQQGTYLASCMFLGKLCSVNPMESTYTMNGTLSDSVCADLRSIADNVLGQMEREE